MELSEHINIIKRYKWFIIIFALAVGLLSFIVGYYKPMTYKAVVSFDVNLTNRPETTDYQYGSYYELKGAEMFTQNAMSWLRTASVIEQIYKQAEVGYEIKNIDQFTNRFTTKQYGAQNFIVTFYDLNLDNAHKIGKAVGMVVAEKTEEANKNPNNKALFTAQASEPIVIENKMNLYLVTILGVIVGLVVSTILVYLKHYLKTAK